MAPLRFPSGLLGRMVPSLTFVRRSETSRITPTRRIASPNSATGAPSERAQDKNHPPPAPRQLQAEGERPACSGKLGSPARSVRRGACVDPKKLGLGIAASYAPSELGLNKCGTTLARQIGHDTTSRQRPKNPNGQCNGSLLQLRCHCL